MAAYTEEEYLIAKEVDLVNLAETLQIPLRRAGNCYQIKGMDSVMIFNRRSWYRFSCGEGGSTIDFLMYFEGMGFKDAVAYLLDYAGYRKIDGIDEPEKRKKRIKEITAEKKKEEKKAPFILPPKAEDNRTLYAYLMKNRKLSQKVIRFWLEKELMYESIPYHNIVFLGRNSQGVVRFASQRGTKDYGKPYKGDVRGNDKTYGVNLINPESTVLNVYEAAIDAMSDMDMRDDYQTSILVLGMLADLPLEKLLENNQQIKILNLCLDNDMRGRKAAEKMEKKYTSLGYEVFIRLPPMGKDYNEYLQLERENRQCFRQFGYRRKQQKTEYQENILKGDMLYMQKGSDVSEQEKGRQSENMLVR